jgi:hypothetical protein
MVWSLILFMTSCGVDRTGHSNTELGEEREEIPLSDFSTRLTNTLLISGTGCVGGEVTVSQGENFICESGQWLVIIDNINHCTPEGCTTVEVVPIIALLVTTSSQGNTDFYDILPAIPVDGARSDILKQVTVSFRVGEAPRVLFK